MSSSHKRFQRISSPKINIFLHCSINFMKQLGFLGQLGRYTKYPCFSCEWGNRDKIRIPDQEGVAGFGIIRIWKQNILLKSLNDPYYVFLHTLRINLEWIIKYACKRFPGLSGWKLKGISWSRCLKLFQRWNIRNQNGENWNWTCKNI